MIEPANIASHLRNIVGSGADVDIEARGISMFPLIPSGATLRISTAEGVVGVNDIVVIPSASGLVAHRVVSVDGENVVTRGDSNIRPDAPVRASQLIGRVTSMRYGPLSLSFDSWPARAYGRMIMACHPLSARVNHAVASALLYVKNFFR